MNVVLGQPPNFEAILQVFPLAAQRGVIFTYGSIIYAPGGGDVSPELRAHEGVHFQQQTTGGMTPERWWTRYLAEADFRVDQETPAHRAEYKQFCALHKDPNARARALAHIAARLAGPLYNNCISTAEARSRIRA